MAGKVKDGAAGIAIKELVELKAKMYSLLVDDNSEHKKAKRVNKNVVERISHSQYKNVFRKCE